MKILIDTREQNPFPFAGELYSGLLTEKAALPTGDYSLAGLTDRIAIERKSIDDLVGCLTRGRERFERELARARGLDLFCVLVEAPWEALSKGLYKSKMTPKSACQSVIAMQARGTSFFFAGSRPAAEYFCFSLLQKYLEGARRKYQQLIKAHDAA